MEPTLVLKTAGMWVAKVAAWWATRNDEAFRHERDELFREWTAELATALGQHISRLQSVEGELESNRWLEELSGSKEFWRVLDNYGYEAAREAIDERRKMLAWAAAGAAAARLTIAQMARVERALRELDPTDLRVLRRLADLETRPIPGSSSSPEQLATLQAKATEKHLLWQETQPSGHVLAASGCILVQDYNFQLPVVGTPSVSVPMLVAVVTVTDLGRWILAATEQFA